MADFKKKRLEQKLNKEKEISKGTNIGSHPHNEVVSPFTSRNSQPQAKTLSSRVQSIDKVDIKTPLKGTVKTTDKGIKTANATSKTAIKTTAQAERITKEAVKPTAKNTQRMKQAVQSAEVAVKSAVKATVSSVKAIIAGTKALIDLLLAGGWLAVLIILIVVILGGAVALLGGDSSSYTPVSAEVQAYEPLIQRYAAVRNTRIHRAYQSCYDAGIRRQR